MPGRGMAPIELDRYGTSASSFRQGHVRVGRVELYNYEELLSQIGSQPWSIR